MPTKPVEVSIESCIPFLFISYDDISHQAVSTPAHSGSCCTGIVSVEST